MNLLLFVKDQLNWSVEIEDFPVDIPKMHSLHEMSMKDRVPTDLWLLQLSFGFLFTESRALGRD